MGTRLHCPGLCPGVATPLVLGAFGRLDLVSVFWDNHIVRVAICFWSIPTHVHSLIMMINTIAAFLNFLYSRKNGGGFN